MFAKHPVSLMFCVFAILFLTFNASLCFPQPTALLAYNSFVIFIKWPVCVAFFAPFLISFILFFVDCSEPTKVPLHPLTTMAAQFLLPRMTDCHQMGLSVCITLLHPLHPFLSPLLLFSGEWWRWESWPCWLAASLVSSFCSSWLALGSPLPSHQVMDGCLPPSWSSGTLGV